MSALRKKGLEEHLWVAHTASSLGFFLFPHLILSD
jgi:hypothetical protein